MNEAADTVCVPSRAFSAPSDSPVYVEQATEIAKVSVYHHPDKLLAFATFVALPMGPVATIGILIAGHRINGSE
jgi:hypothetical protein